MNCVQIDFNKHYTFADYLTWMDDKRRELINGRVNMMTPAPSVKHQDILSAINSLFWNYLRNKKCKVFPAPFDARFPSEEGETSNEKILTVVQPDICVVCDLSKLDDRGCLGAPDLIVEIISPTSAKNDINEKFKIYEENGVKEYWIIQPNDKTITVFILDNGKYQHKGMYTHGTKLRTDIFPDDFKLDLDLVFNQE
jgi:Uma2 family endonuclease